MIVDQILDLLEAVLTWVIELLPSSSSFPDVVSEVAGLLGYLDDLNFFLPIEEVFSVVVAVLFVFPVLMGTTLSLWVLAQLRGSSSRG